MKKHTAYYVIGAVLVGTGIYLYASKNKNKDVQVNLNPPMEVNEQQPATTPAPASTQTNILSGLDKLKALIDSIKSKSVSTPPIKA